MSEYQVKIDWTRKADELFIDNKYSRSHQWEFDGGLSVAASSSPHIVPLPYSVAENVDPEEAFIASLSSCHMLFFLSIAAKHKIKIDSYIDNAVGVMEKDDAGKVAMTLVTLKPKVTPSEGQALSFEELESFHHQAHELCFIANSVKTKIVTDIVYFRDTRL
ncbi:peroxiredoxin [Pseudoalteromonas porphyrae]|uniref:OsmC family protein n=1 Tax=Pseudoalteromonas TaxID=53246 RepID=UPI0006BA8ABF|nr:MULTISPECIES: OsmC family protein [Pseudoalteromonas]KPH93113.1 peroxiredoxin [Pseudoalteromonas porphyrae]NMR27204.1 OsmC family peroxiredoxin [Pseudoalteromonas sp. NEC-BIFX-2020_015]